MGSTHWVSIAAIAFLSTALLSACGSARAPQVAQTRVAGHGDCVSCHRTTDPSSRGSAQLFAGGIEPSSACLDCHHYDVNHHPVNVAPKDGSAAAAQSTLPLFDGQIKCLTCHQAHVNAGHKELSSTPRLLRGGPYADQRALCLLCHGQDDYSAIDPHKMLTPDGSVREVNGEPVCLLCHTTKPDPAGDPDLVEFKADVAFLCWRCHAPMAGSFLRQHFHVKPGKQTRVALAKEKRRSGRELPLARDGMLTCSTCHNPHQAGVLTRPAVQTGADAPRKLRIEKESICRACHEQ